MIRKLNTANSQIDFGIQKRQPPMAAFFAVVKRRK